MKSPGAAGSKTGKNSEYLYLTSPGSPGLSLSQSSKCKVQSYPKYQI
jgi:hypothetical protein